MEEPQEIRMFEILADALNQVEKECGCKMVDLSINKSSIEINIALSEQLYNIMIRKMHEGTQSG